MWRLLRITLMCLMAFAVPAQGFAAAFLFNCGPGHHGRVSAPQLVSHAEAAHDHAHGAESAPARHHDDGAVAHDPDGAAASDGDNEPVWTSGSCGACGSCCTASALPTAAVTLGATPVHNFIAPLAPSSVAAFLTDGPERPPRLFLV